MPTGWRSSSWGLLVGLGATIALAASAPSAPARADDWAITREAPGRAPRSRPGARAPARRDRPSPARSHGAAADGVDRWVALALEAPDDDAVVARLLRSAGEGGLAALLASLAPRRATEPRVEALWGAIALARTEYDEASRSFEAARSRDPELAPAYALAARLALRRASRGDAPTREEAARLLAQAVAHAPTRAAREGYSRALLDVLVELPSAFERALALHEELSRGGSSEARLSLARALVRAERFEDALTALEAVRPSLAGDASGLVSSAILRLAAEARLGRSGAVREVAVEAWPAARESARTEELLEALTASAREAGALEELVPLLTSWGTRADAARAVVLEELGHDDEALALYRTILRRTPRDAELLGRVSRLLARTGRIDEAIDVRRALARLFPDRVAFSLELARALVERGERDEAISALDRARSRARGERSVLFLLADAYSRIEAHDRVRATLEAIVRANPRDARGVMALASELFRSTAAPDRARAERLVADFARSGRGAENHLEAARALANVRQFERALEELDAAARVAPDDPATLDAAIEIHELAGRFDDAERALTRRIELAGASDDPLERRAGLDAELRLVALWARRRTLPLHRASLTAAAQGGDARAARLLVELERRSGDLEASSRALARLVAAHPEDPHLVSRAARLAHERGDYDAEVAALLQLVQLEPERAGSHLVQLVELAIAAYRDDDVARFAGEAERRVGGDVELLLRLGRLYARRQDRARASRLFERALEADPDALEAAWELAQIEASSGDARRALSLQLAVLERTRDDALRARVGGALLETARATDAEALVEPRLLALALSHGDAPVFRRLALSLTAALASAARSRGDEAALERGMTRALPILLAGLRDRDLAMRATARQLLFAHPVPAASSSLLSLAADDTIAPPVRAAALRASLGVLTARDVPALRALLDAESRAESGEGRALAVVALHALGRLAAEGQLERAEWQRTWTRLRERPDELGARARLLALLSTEEPPLALTLPPRSVSEPGWMTSLRAARGSSVERPLGLDLTRFAATPGEARREAPPALFELGASGRLDEPTLESLARLSLTRSDAAAQLFARALGSRLEVTLACAPPPEPREGVEAWLARVVASCPRRERDGEAVARAVTAAVASLEGEGLELALANVARWPRAGLEAHVGSFLRAFIARAPQLRGLSPGGRLELARLLPSAPDALSPEGWRALLGDEDRRVRVLAVEGIPLPTFTAIASSFMRSEGAWEVQRAALARLAASPPDDRAALEEIARVGLGSDVALVRREALTLLDAPPVRDLLGQELRCALVSEALHDEDPSVARLAAALARGPSAR